MIAVMTFAVTTSAALWCFVTNPGWPAACMFIVSMFCLGTSFDSAPKEETPPNPAKDMPDTDELKRQVDKIAEQVQRLNSQSNLVAAFAPRK